MLQMKEGEPQVLGRATQEYEMVEMLDSISKRLTNDRVVIEHVDNAWDKRIPGETLHFSVQYNPNDRRIVFSDSSTWGMTDEDIRTYIKFGKFGRTRGEDDRGVHGFGGKVTQVTSLDKGGSVKIISTPPNSKTTYSVFLENWRANLEPGKDWDILGKVRTSSDREMTMFILEKVIPERIINRRDELVKVAKKLGVTYGPDIESEKMEISLSLIKGRKAETISVIPETISFVEEQKKSERKKSGEGGGGPEIEVTWGQIDVQKRNKMQSDAEKKYIVKVRSFLGGNKVHIYNRGKYIQSKDLADLGYIGYRPRLGFNNWAVCVNIIHGKVNVDLFKEMLDPTDPNTEAVLHTVRSLTQQDVKRISQESDKKRDLTEHQKAKARLANVVFRETMHILYSTKEAFAQEYNLMVRKPPKVIFQSQDTIDTNVKKEGGIYLPGSRVTYTRGGSRKGKEGGSITDLEPAYADTVLGSFGDGSLETKIVEEGGKVFVVLNLENISIQNALDVGPNESVLSQIRFAAEALVQRKYNGQAHYEILQEEVTHIMNEVGYHLEVK